MKIILVSTFTALAIGGSVWAAENLATGSGTWTNAAIWDQGHVPNATDDRAKVWANHIVTVDSVVAQAVSNIRLGSNLNNPGHLVINSGAALTNNGLLEISGGLSTTGGSSLTVDGTYYNGGDMNVGHVSTTGLGGKLNINNGASVRTAGNVNIGLGSTGTVTMIGGTFIQSGDKDTTVSAGANEYGELNMSGGSWTTGDDLLVGCSGTGNNRRGLVTLSGGSTMNVTDDLFLAGINGYDNNRGEVIVNDAALNVNDIIFVGRANTSTGTLTLAHADAQVSVKQLFVAENGGRGMVNLLDGELFVNGISALDNDIRIGADGEVSFEKGILVSDDPDVADEFAQFWIDGKFTATKNGANALSLTNNLASVTYSQDLGDKYTAWVGLDADGNPTTFVTIPEPTSISLFIISSGLIVWIRRRNIY
jgi:hypothetical protein